MTGRRREPAATPMMQAGSPAYNKIMTAIEKQGADSAERLDAFFDRMNGRMDRLERDVGSLDLRHGETVAKLIRELDEVRRDLGETRDAVTISDKAKTEAAAKGAAAGATQAAGEVAAKLAGVAVPKRWWEKWQAWGVAFVGLVVFIKNVGPFVIELNKFWAYLGSIGADK